MMTNSDEPDYETEKLQRLAKQISYMKPKIITETSPPSLLLDNGEVVSISGGYVVGTFGRTFSARAAAAALRGLEPEPDSSAHGVKWGWLSLPLSCYEPTERESGIRDSGFEWHRPSRAAKIAGVSTRNLRQWAQAGLLSHLHEPEKHHRYLRAELDFIKEIGADQKVTTPALRACAEAALYGFLTADASGRVIRCT